MFPESQEQIQYNTNLATKPNEESILAQYNDERKDELTLIILFPQHSKKLLSHETKPEQTN